jgi:hypothetical protein
VAAVVALGALELAWSSSGADTWPAAGAVVTGRALATAGWLQARGWAAGAVLAVLAAPVAVLAAPPRPADPGRAGSSGIGGRRAGRGDGDGRPP